MTTRRTVQRCTINESVPTTVGASQTNAPISLPCTVYSATEIRVDILVSTATAGAGITFKLQQSPGAGIDHTTPVWLDGPTATVSADVTSGTDPNGKYFTITLQTAKTADEQYLPLADMVRVVATTPAGAVVVVDRVYILS